MENIYYIGLDAHKKSIAYCIKTVTGKMAYQRMVKAERRALQQWLVDLPGSWVGATYNIRKLHGKKYFGQLMERVELLRSISGVGEVMALTWVLEIGNPERFNNSRQAISYYGLCSAQHESAGKEHRRPISKKRNKYLQSMLIEAVNLLPYWNPQLAMLYEKELTRGNRNRRLWIQGVSRPTG